MKSTLRRSKLVATVGGFALAVGVSLTACGDRPVTPPAPPSPAKPMTKTFSLPRVPKEGEMVNALIGISEIPRKAKVVISDGRGTLLGVLTPFGRVGANSKSHTFTVPIPAQQQAGGKVDLIFEIEENGKRRPLAEGELVSVEIQMAE
jgi:hypothetical protein